MIMRIDPEEVTEVVSEEEEIEVTTMIEELSGE
jgi:hypothetical protein